MRRRFAGLRTVAFRLQLCMCVLLTFSVIISERSFLVLDLCSRWLSSGFRSLIWEFDAVSSQRE